MAASPWWKTPASKSTAYRNALAATGLAQAQKGGKVAWNENPQKAMAEARKTGAGMMLYFTSEG